jgi:hypothetical protein
MSRLEKWVALAEGRVDAAERRRLEALLAQASDAERALVAELRELFAAISSDFLLDPSRESIEAVLRSFRQKASPAQLPPGAVTLRDAVSTLVFDSFAHPEAAFAGARSAGVARRVLFEAHGVELDVLVETDGDRRRLTAQLLRTGPEPTPLSEARWIVTTAGRIDAEGETDAYGEFVQTVGPGETEIRVAVDRDLIVFSIPEHLSESSDG